VADPRTGRLLYAAHLGATQVDGLGAGGTTVATTTAAAYRNQVRSSPSARPTTRPSA